MTLKLKARNGSDGRKLNGCWITDCGYGVTFFKMEDAGMYMVTPPGSSTPIAYTGDKAQVKAVIINHKAGAKKSDS